MWKKDNLDDYFEKIANYIDEYSKWQNRTWYIFHAYAFEYPNDPNENDKLLARLFYENIFIKFIACDYCKKHYMEMLKYNEVQTENKNTLFKWTVDIHNKVNQRLKKDIMEWKDIYKWFEYGFVGLPKNKEIMMELNQFLSNEKLIKEYYKYNIKKQKIKNVKRNDISMFEKIYLLPFAGIIIFFIIMILIIIKNRKK